MTAVAEKQSRESVREIPWTAEQWGKFVEALSDLAFHAKSLVAVPCPRCGRDPKVTNPERGIHAVECKCGLSLRLPPKEIERALAEYVVREWNHRASRGRM